MTIDLFSPEMNADAGTLAQHEEPNGPLDTTTFELYAVGTVVGPGFNQPAAGTGVLLTNYPPAPAGTAETWVRFATINRATCGSYVIRSQTANDDQNGWRVRVGYDADNNVLTPPVTDLDGIPGTDDEFSSARRRSATSRTRSELVHRPVRVRGAGPGHHGGPQLRLRRLRHPGLVGQLLLAIGRQHAGTISNPDATWNVSNAISRGAGDVIANPQTGWWRFASCISSGNQFIQEGQQGTTAYSEHPPTPLVTVAKTDGRLAAAPGDSLTYTVHIANPGDPAFPGAATAVVATDTLPANTTFIGCALVAPASGVCSQSSPGVVTATLSGHLNSGGSADFTVQVTVGGGASGSLTNGVSVGYNDSFGNPFAPVTATDTDTVGTASLGDFVFLDKNANGAQDGGDVGLAGVAVTAVWFGLDATFGTPDDVTFSATTDSAGIYGVSGLPGGTYRVQAAGPPGTSLSVGSNPTNVALANGQARTDVDFGFAGTGSIGDTAYLDKNGNGTQDAGDTGLASVPVTVTWAGPDTTVGTSDDVVFTATTNGVGVYAATGLPAGNYSVAATAAPGFANTTADPFVTTLAAGQNRTDADFGFNGTASIGDFVWFDRDGDGVQDPGEPGLSNVTVSATCAGPDGIAGTADDVVRSASTDVAGAYTIGNLPPGTCAATVNSATLPPGMTGTTPGPIAVTLTPGEMLVSADFGFNGTGSIGDTVFDDLNGDGTQQAGESGIGGAAVSATWAGPDATAGTADDVVSTTTTDASGAYLFAGLPAGGYSVDPTGPAGFSLTTGADPLAVALSPGQVFLTADFGYRGTASMGDTVFDDQNGNGIQDGTEPGIVGVVVNATWAGFDGIAGSADDVVFSATTGAGGTYTIPNLAPGGYTVAVGGGLPAGFVATTAAPIDTTLTPAEVEVTDDFGFQQQADLAITKGTGTPTVVVGQNASWTVSVTNNGPALAAAPIVVTDTLPGGTTFVSATGLNWGCAEVSGTITCTYAGGPPSLANGGSLPLITVTATVTASAAFTITNSAAVASPTADPNPANNTASSSVTTQPAADATIAKSHAGNFLVGSQGSYSILVANNGPSAAAGPFTVTDPLPAGLTFVSAAGTGWTCGESAGTVTCTATGPLANGGSLPAITVTVGVTPGAEGGVTNTATVDAGTTLDPNPGNNSASDPTAVVPVADVSLVKTAPGPFVAGSQAGYTLAVANVGPSSAAGPLTVTDTLPAGLTFTSAVGPGWSCAAIGSDITCSLPGPLAAGGSSAIAVTVAVDSNAASVLTNTATVTGPTLDPDPTNNTSTVQTPTTPAVDLAIAKSHAGTFVIGTPAAYTLVVANNGPSAATPTITVHDDVPGGLTPSGAAGSGWTCSVVAQAVTCTTDDDVASGASLPTITVTVTVTAAAYPSVTNSATVDTPTGTSETVTTNNTAADPTTIASRADLAVAKTHSGDFRVGTNGTYRVTVTNNGPTEALGPVVVRDTLTGGLGLVSGEGDGFVCAAVGQDVTCTRGAALPNGAAATIVLVVSVGSAAQGTFVNHAAVTSPTVDPNPNNDGADDSTTAQPDVDLTLDKAVASTPVSGTTTTWTIAVRNVGLSDAAGPITVTDVLPSGLTFVSGGGDGWVCSAAGQTVSCVHDALLGSGGSSTISIVTLVTAPPGTAISNTASVSSTNLEIAIDNNRATASIPSVAAPLTTSNTATTSTALAATGRDSRRMAAVGSLLIALGIVLTVLASPKRRRRPAPTRCG